MIDALTLFPVRASVRMIDSWSAARDGGLHLHHATDLIALELSAVVAGQFGVVERVTTPSTSTHGGNSVAIIGDTRPSGVQFRSYNAHLNRATVVEGQRVKPWTVIGLVGRTGNAFSSHLHFGLKGRRPREYQRWYDLDPFPALLEVAHPLGHATYIPKPGR